MRRLSGIPAAEGIAFGHAFIVDRRRIKTPKRHLVATSQVQVEIERFELALETTDRQLQKIKEKLFKAGGQEHTLILQAHQLILKDEQLVEQTKRYIVEDMINAEWALRRTISGIKLLFDQVEDDYFRERRSDVDFVADHLMYTLTGKNAHEQPPPRDSIVVTYSLSPADAARFYRIGVKAFVMEVGGRTSHTSIIARSLGIPAVVGIKELNEIIGTGDKLIVDGYRGEVLCSPDEETIRRYQRRSSRRARFAQGLRRERELPAETLDGVRIHLLANIELSDEIPTAVAHGAEGIGLYRTEFLYLGRETLPLEEDHYRDALQVLNYAMDIPITFRTCDLGADKIPGCPLVGLESNPALGLRSIRLCLERQEVFKSQLRGVLRATTQGDIRIMFPMISGIEVFRQAKQVLSDCQAELAAEGVAIKKIPVGVMIEMPSAAITADLLAEEVDFFSIGTNDLTQYALAIDRANEHVNHLFKPYHPAILRLIHNVIAAGDRANIPVIVCGEMAADPAMTLVLMGLGVRRLSMNSLAIPNIKRLIRSSYSAAASGLAQKALELATPQEVENLVSRTMKELFPEQKFSAAEVLEEDTLF